MSEKLANWKEGLLREPTPKPPKRGPKPPKPLPRATKPIRQRGKQASKWASTRREWLKANPPDYRGMWQCSDCKSWTTQIDLDHLKKRGSHPELRYNLDNLEPVCRGCHIKRDSGMRYE